MSGTTRVQPDRIVKGKCPTCGHATGGPFTPSEFLALHPELNVAPSRPELPAELIELRDTAYGLFDEMNEARAKAAQASFDAARVRWEQRPQQRPGEAERPAEQVNEAEQFWRDEAEEVCERWLVANTAYHAAARAHTLQRAQEKSRADADALAAREEAERVSKRSRHDRLRELMMGAR